MSFLRKIKNLFEDYDFGNGDRVVLTPEYQDKPGEVYTLSQWDGNRGWIGDEDGRGWFVRGYQIELAPEEDDEDDQPFIPYVSYYFLTMGTDKEEKEMIDKIESQKIQYKIVGTSDAQKMMVNITSDRVEDWVQTNLRPENGFEHSKYDSE